MAVCGFCKGSVNMAVCGFCKGSVNVAVCGFCYFGFCWPGTRDEVITVASVTAASAN